MNLSEKSLKTFGIVFVVLIILTGISKIVALRCHTQRYSLPDGLPIIFMLAAFGCFSAAKRKKEKESKNT